MDVMPGGPVSAALDPVMVPAGFQAGQEGGGDDFGDRVQAIFCAGHDGLSDRYPWLPQSHAQESGGTCIDLVVELNRDGIVQFADLEELTLEETLSRVGRTEDAASVA